MTRPALTLIVLLMAGPAVAQPRPFAPAMSCAAAAGLVAARGAVVMSTGPNSYDRFVADSRFCALDQTTSPAYVTTLDAAQCWVGYYCRPIEHGEPRQ